MTTSVSMTIGIATFRDYDGLFFTINSLRLFHADALSRCEIIVVDNDPDGPQAERVRHFVQQVASGIEHFHAEGLDQVTMLSQPLAVRYIAHEEYVGTASPRDRIFAEAIGDVVLVLDSHVQLWPDAIRVLLEYFESRPLSHDVVQGPVVMDDWIGVATHFDDVWRGGMWGTWGRAWQDPHNQVVSVRESHDHRVEMHHLNSTLSTEVLDVLWAGHESSLIRIGYKPADQCQDAFEIPAQGLGVFACRKDAWPGFHPLFREFGGEEWYLHLKVRQRGHRVWCLPGLKWMHRFADPAAGRRYPRSHLGKIRNYILGHRELGLPLDRIHRHFVDGLSEDLANPGCHGGRISLLEWNWLVDHAEEYPIRVGHKAKGLRQISPELELLFRSALATKSDLYLHCRKLRELASGCDVIVEIGAHASPSTVAFLAGQPRRLLTWTQQPLDDVDRSKMVTGDTVWEHYSEESLLVEIPDCDLLFLDALRTGEQLGVRLERHLSRCRRYLVLHDTQTYGRRGEDGHPGLINVVQKLVTDRPGWAVIYHAPMNNGLTVLSCREDDHPRRPIRLWPIGFGPGTELKKLLANLGIQSAPSCGCNARASQMDEWGVEGCRQRHGEIVQWLRDGQSQWGWSEKLSTACKAIASGLAFQLNPLDPYPSLVDEAIRRAAIQQRHVVENPK